MRFVLIASGKGGVGKTIFALSLGSELSKRGARCGVLDTDIDDSNTLQLLGMKGEVGLTEDKRFVPIRYDGVELFAMPGITGDRPISMEGGEYSQIISDVIHHTDWHSDYCVVDCPAGSADAIRTMMIEFSDSLLGSIIIVQPAHSESARRMLELFIKEGIPVLGLVENMSEFKCDCGREYPIFGSSVLDELAKEYGVEPLGKIPLSMDIKEAVGKGGPLLKGELAKPVERAAEVVLAAKPVEPGLIERLKQRAKGMARAGLIDLMAGLVGIINTEIDIASYQRAYAFPGGQTIELDVTDRSMRKVNAQMFFRIEGGLLKVVKNPKRVDQEIRVWDSAFIWAVLGEKPVGGRKVQYDFMTAWLLGEIKYFGARGGTQQAISFFRDVWRDLSVRVRENKRLMGVLGRLA